MNTGRPVHWDWEAVRSVALTSGLSLAEVARQFGIPYNSVKSKARREGWEVNQVFGKVYRTRQERVCHTIKAVKKTVGEMAAAGNHLCFDRLDAAPLITPEPFNPFWWRLDKLVNSRSSVSFE
jgi:hypothetical protein